MPITFEEVTAEVPGERPAPPAAAAGGEATSGKPDDAATERLLRALALQQEREWRVRVD